MRRGKPGASSRVRAACRGPGLQMWSRTAASVNVDNLQVGVQMGMTKSGGVPVKLRAV